MRLYEVDRTLIGEEVTIFDLHHEMFDMIANMDIDLFENKDEYLQFKETLRQFSTDAPIVGDEYMYTSVSAVPTMQFTNIGHFKKPHQLIGISDDKYLFDINGTIKSYPEQGGIDHGAGYQHIFMFSSVQEKDEMETMLQLTYAPKGWKITKKELK